MKIVELLNNIRIPITNEESDLMDLFNEHGEIQKNDLSPRHIVLANQLVNKDILLRINETGRITYKKKIT